MVKTAIKYICYGISWGCTCLVFFCALCSAAGGEEILRQIAENFTAHALGAVLVGIACGSTSAVYRCGRLPRAAQVMIHFGVGMGVFFPVALWLDWIPFRPDRAVFTFGQFLLSCAIFAAIWFCFYLYYRGEAGRINRRLRELENGPGEPVSGNGPGESGPESGPRESGPEGGSLEGGNGGRNL